MEKINENIHFKSLNASIINLIGVIKNKQWERLNSKSMSVETDLKNLNEFLSSPKKEYNGLPSENGQPNEIEVGNIVIDKLSRDEYWNNPRNRKTRIIAEILMRECYLTGWNNHLEKAMSEIEALKAEIAELKNKYESKA